MTIPFTLQHLRILKAIDSEKSFTKASEVLFISQPSLSKHLKILENQVGILLINRRNNNISLTDAGKLFLNYADRILALCEESYRALKDLQNGERGNLIVGASQTTGTYLLPRVLVLFVKDYPQISLNLKVDSTSLIAKNVVDQNIDIAIVEGDIPKNLQKNLKIEHFVNDEFNLIVPKSHPFAIKESKIINKEDLYKLNFITLNSTSTINQFIENSLIQHGIKIDKFNIILQLNSLEAIKTAVSLGLGVAFVSSSTIEKEIKLQTIDIIKIKNIKITRPLSIITNVQAYNSKAVKFLHDELLILKKDSYTNKF